MPHKMDIFFASPCLDMPRVMQVAESPGFSSAFEAGEATRLMHTDAMESLLNPVE